MTKSTKAAAGKSGAPGIALVRAASRKARTVNVSATSGGDGHPVEVIDPKAPLSIARRIIHRLFNSPHGSLLRFWRDGFWHYSENGWRPLSDQQIADQLYAFLETCRKLGSDGRLAPCHPNARLVQNVAHALRSVPPPFPVPLAETLEPPCWLPSEMPSRRTRPGDEPPASEMIPVANGLVHAPRGELWSPTPELFATTASPVRFLDDADKEPVSWLAFLDGLFPDDPASIATIQEWFGYCLTADMSQQKIMLMVGPPRSGKSTIARVLTALIGPLNVCAPTLAALTGPFALAPLIGKTLAIVGDARLGRLTDQAIIVERLVSISGEDAVTIDRKHQPAWSGRLTAKFMLLTNELPNLGDTSGAFSSRLVVLHLKQSFLGQEDHGLYARLMDELPLILPWAVKGWQKLYGRGHFVQPDAGKDTLDTMRDLSSDMSTFVRDCCVIGPREEAGSDAVYSAYVAWRETQCIDGRISKPQFAKRLRSVCPSISLSQPRSEGARLRIYVGISLKPNTDISLF